ncbi:MAG: GNAT family N-acetyltransferase [Desulfobacterales bacterium]|nr:GNAT family N-acetyltransferase [Desulfobacterales bacterium]
MFGINVPKTHYNRKPRWFFNYSSSLCAKFRYDVPENIGRIDTIGVDPDYQRKGIAKILFREMANNLKKVGVDTIITFVTRRDWILLKFFNSMGFQKGDMINLELDI